MRALEPGMMLRSYRLVQRIGRGGGGDVWSATTSAGSPVALKALPRTGDVQERRLRQEFERLRSLRLPNVVRVLDVGADQGYVFFTMELAEGATFDHFIADATSLEDRVDRTIRAGMGIAQALIGMHGLGLAHRDLKPDNVLVDGTGHVTLIDFGTVRFEAETDAAVGTVAYMAPEQRLGQHEDHRADLYALGLLLHEAVSAEPSGSHPVGSPRRSLALLGSEVPLELAHLVDRLTALDVAVRPSAIETESVLAALCTGGEVPRAPWPQPTAFVGAPDPLLVSSALVVGEPGSGRTRLVQEARWAWFKQGYPSVAGRAVPDRPYGPFVEIVPELLELAPRSAMDALDEADRAILKFLVPDAPFQSARAPAFPLDPEATAKALLRLVEGVGPLALVFWSLDGADPGTRAVLPALLRSASETTRIWATARGPVLDLRRVSPAPWSPAAEARALPTLLPDHTTFPGGPATTPLDGCARAWRVLAHLRGEPGPVDEVPANLERLTVLEEPFPASVAYAISDEVDGWIDVGHLERLEGDRIRFRDRGTHRLAARHVGPAEHLRAAKAWSEQSLEKNKALAVAHHAVLGGEPTPAIIEAAIRRVLDLADPVELDRWVQLWDLHFAGRTTFIVRYAHIYVELHLRPAEVTSAHLQELTGSAGSLEEQGLAAHLSLLWRAPGTDVVRLAQRGRAWAQKLAGAHPSVASKILRESALAWLGVDDMEATIRDCTEALKLARNAALREDEPTEPRLQTDEGSPTLLPDRPDVPVSPDEVAAAITLSAALIYQGRLTEAVSFCGELRKRCHQSGFHRGYGALVSNEALGLLSQGLRAEARQALAESRDVQRLHRDPVILANTAVLQARLAVERGDLSGTRRHLDIAATAAESLDFKKLLCEVWTLVLEAAVQTANKTDAERAITAYGVGASTRDHWPAVLARWRWLVGDIEGALAATEARRIGHSGRCVEAERARLLLVSGRTEEAKVASVRLLEKALVGGMEELALFARLVSGAAVAAADGEYQPLVDAARESRWVHLHLGSLHLDAIRRQQRGENVGGILRHLRSRSRDIGHRLYLALGREDAWT